jgi:hypothetical protein
MQLEPEAFSIKDPMALTQRWESKAVQGDGQMDESAVSTGSQSSRQRVRMGLAKLALTKEYSLLPKLLASNDPGLRCAAYGTGRLKPDELQAAYDMDGSLRLTMHCRTHGIGVKTALEQNSRKLPGPW